MPVHRREGPARDERLSTSSLTNSKASPVFLKVGPISGMMNIERSRNMSSDNRNGSHNNTTSSPNTSTTNNDNGDGYGSGEKIKMMRSREKSGKLIVVMTGTSFGNDNSSYDTPADTSIAESRSILTFTTKLNNTRPTTFISSTEKISSIREDGSETQENDIEGNSKKVRNEIISKPVYETFSPVFRPSPLDFDGYNVSLNFESSQLQNQNAVGNNNPHNPNQLQQHYKRYHHHLSRQLQVTYLL